MAAIWAEVLGLAAGSFGMRASFLDLGGDSLKAVKMVGRLRNRYAVELSLSKLFEAPTVEYTARLIEQSKIASETKGDQTEIDRGAL